MEIVSAPVLESLRAIECDDAARVANIPPETWAAISPFRQWSDGETACGYKLTREGREAMSAGGGA